MVRVAGVASRRCGTWEDSRCQLVPLPRALLLTKEVPQLALLLTSVRSRSVCVCVAGEVAKREDVNITASFIIFVKGHRVIQSCY